MRRQAQMVMVGLLGVMLMPGVASAQTLSLPDGTVTANRQDSSTGGSAWFGESVTTLTIDAENLSPGQYVKVSGKITGLSAPTTSWAEIGLIPKNRWDYWQTAYSGNFKAAVFDKGLYVVHWDSSGLALGLQEGWDDWTSTTYHNKNGGAQPYAWPLASPTGAVPWDFAFTMDPAPDPSESYLSVVGGTMYGTQPFPYGIDDGQPVANDNDYSECYLIAQIWSTVANGSFSFTDVQAALISTEVWVAPPPTGDDGNPGTEAEPFATIQKGIDTVAEGGIVHVAAGAYQENLASWKDMEITKSLSLVGAGSGSTVVELTEGKMNGVEICGSGMDVLVEGITFTRQAGSTYAAGFNLRIAETASSFTSLVLRDVEVAYASGRNVFLGGTTTYDSIVVENCSFHHSGAWGFSARGTILDMTITNSDFEYNGLDDAGHGIGFDIDMPISVVSLQVEGGSFSHNTSKGINLVNTNNATFTGIAASDNSGSPAGGFGVSLWEWVASSSNLTFTACTISNNSSDGVLFGTEGTTSLNDVTIQNCFINGNGRAGILFYHDYGGSVSDISITNCDLSGSGWWGAIPTSALGTMIDASGNWYGETTPSAVGGLVGSNVDYTPWLADGSDTSGDPGFQGDLSELWVDDDSPQSGAEGRIQEGIGMVSGSTVNVAAGTYDENVVINTAVTLLGAQAGVDARGRSATESVVTASSGHVFDVRAANVVIDGFHFNGSGSTGQLIRAEDGGSGLQVRNCIFDGGAIRAFWFNVSSPNVMIEQNDLDASMMTDSYALAHFDGSDVFDDLTIRNNNFANGGIFAGNKVFNSVRLTMTGNLFDGASLNLSSQFRDATISENTFRNNGYTNAQVGLKDSTISANVFESAGPSPYSGNPSYALMLWGDQYGLTPSENVTLENNVFEYNQTAAPDELEHGLRVLSGIDGSTIAVAENAFLDGGAQAGAFAVRNQGTGTVDASGNWWDSADKDVVPGLLDGSIDYTPWLANGTDTGDPGFQGDFSELWVDDDSPQVGAQGRIEEAIGLVTASTINLAPGTYEEQVEIDMDDLELIGAGSGANPAVDSIIQSPASLSYKFTTGTNDNYPIVGVHDATGVLIQNLRVDGLGRGNANYRFVGIGFWNGDGTVDGCYVTGVRDNPLSGAQHGLGIYAYNDDSGPYTIEVADTVVDDYQKNGMALLGDGLTFNVHGCTVTGGGPMGSGLPAQNGIQVGYGAGGSVDGCTICDHLYTAGTWASTGLLPIEATSLQVTNTQLNDNNPGAYCIDGDATFSVLTVANGDPDSWDGLYAYNTTGAKLREDGGPRLLAAPFVPGDAADRSSGNRAVMTVSIAHSSFVGHDKADSWGVAAFATGTDTVNLSLTASAVRDWDYGVVAYDWGGPVSATANYNQIYSNTTYGFYSDIPATVMDAEYNWWGEASGPLDASGSDEADNPPCFDPSTMSNTDGGGNAVTDLNVDYCPWLATTTTVTLNPDKTCYDAGVGDIITITIDLSDVAGPYSIVGGQFFLSYDDAVLLFISAAPGDAPFTREVYEQHPGDGGAGTLDYAVGTPDGVSGTTDDTTMAVLTFGALAEVCNVADLVEFRSHTPPSRLSDEYGGAVNPQFLHLEAITIDGTPPNITCPDDITVNADAGLCTASIDPGMALAVDNCDPNPTIEYKRSDRVNWNEGLLDPYPQGTTTITWRATDYCGHYTECIQTITVSGDNEMLVNVQLSPTLVPGTITRCITFELWGGCPHDAPPDAVVSQEVTFTGGVANAVPVLVPCDTGPYACITARDELHTLRRTDEGFHISGTQYVADFTGDPGSGGDWLIGGNLNDDYWIDILDFGVFSYQWNENYGTGDTTCSTPYPHADINGDGIVTSGDFTFIQINFLESHEPNCCSAPGFREGGEGGEGPVTEISVAELIERGLGHLAAADLNRDGWLDAEDVEAFMAGVRPRQPIPAETVDVEKVPAIPQRLP